MVYCQGPLWGGICSQQSMTPRGLVPLLVLPGPLHILVGAGSQGYGNRQVSREPDGLGPWGLGSKWRAKRKRKSGGLGGNHRAEGRRVAKGESP